MAARTSALAEATIPSRRPDRIDKSRRVKWQQWPKTNLKPGAINVDGVINKRPDLQDDAFIAWGLQNCDLECAGGTNVEIDILYVWGHPRDDGELVRILGEATMRQLKPSLRICSINTLGASSGWLPGNFSPRPETIRILRDAGLSGILLSNLFSEQSYWAKMGNQRFMHYNEQGDLESFDICYQYRCGWDTGVSFIHAIRKEAQTTYFCINYPSGARERLDAIYRNVQARSILHRDFFLDTLVADDSLKQWQFDIGERRLALLQLERQFEVKSEERLWDISELQNDGIRSPASTMRPGGPRGTDIEKQVVASTQEQPGIRTEKAGVNAPDSDESADFRDVDFDTATRSLHRLVRHWLGLRQDCEDLLAQLKFLHDTYIKIKEKRGARWIVDKTVDAGESFEALQSQCDICVRWTQAYHDRTQTRIGLLFHLANQRTATDTARIAEQTQRDSASMITIAAVTMLFLPGTFVCTVVSTNFFNFGEQGLQVSHKWWILLAVAVPLTFVVFGAWLSWQQMRRKSQRLAAKLKRLELQKYIVAT